MLGPSRPLGPQSRQKLVIGLIYASARSEEGREGRTRMVGVGGGERGEALCRGDGHPAETVPCPPEPNTGKSASESMGLC